MQARLGDAPTGDGAAVAGNSGAAGAAEAAIHARAGERALTILATPLNFLALRALAERPMRLAELRQATGLPAQTTLRGHLASLSQAGALSKRPTAEMPYTVQNELTPMGHDLLEVAARLEDWLKQAPQGPVSLEGGAGKGFVKALVDGWGSAILRSLAAQPMSLTELDRGIADLSYPALERRLSSMRMAGLIEARASHGAGTPYAVTEWARRGVTPLLAAAKCERVHMGKRAAPLTPADIEAAFLLATPLVGLPADTTGCCQLEVEGDPAQARAEAGVTVTVERGKVIGCDSELRPSPGDFAIGSAAKWFSAIKDGKAGLLRFGGGRRVAEGIVIALHTALIGR